MSPRRFRSETISSSEAMNLLVALNHANLTSFTIPAGATIYWQTFNSSAISSSGPSPFTQEVSPGRSPVQ
jgi:hypothetical protein